MLKTASTVATILSFILLFSVTVCALWIRFGPQPVDESGIRFHAMIGLVTMGVLTVTLIIHSVLIKQLSA